MFEIEKDLIEKGYKIIAGVDEAGRGPLAGSVFAAAVILPLDFKIEKINDSKKLTPKIRDELFEIIIENSKAYSISSIDHMVIDEINILNATFKAMVKAVENLQIPPDFVIVDGNRINGLTTPHNCIVKGDSKSQTIAAASILAKVSRDREMIRYDEIYPQYGFKKHKGYGTKEHIENILKHGPCPIHRRSFLKKIMERA